MIERYPQGKPVPSGFVDNTTAQAYERIHAAAQHVYPEPLTRAMAIELLGSNANSMATMWLAAIRSGLVMERTDCPDRLVPVHPAMSEAEEWPLPGYGKWTCATHMPVHLLCSIDDVSTVPYVIAGIRSEYRPKMFCFKGFLRRDVECARAVPIEANSIGALIDAAMKVISSEYESVRAKVVEFGLMGLPNVPSIRIGKRGGDVVKIEECGTREWPRRVLYEIPHNPAEWGKTAEAAERAIGEFDEAVAKGMKFRHG